MANREKVTELGRLFGAVARSHHEETGGVNPNWAHWYAGRLSGQIDPLIGYSPEAEEIEAWLVEADRRYRAEAPDVPWPFFYAEMILDSTAPDSVPSSGE
jgi:hypothetical protein